MIRIPLTQGEFALIDDADFEQVNKYGWFAHKCGHRFYANRSFYRDRQKITESMHRMILGLRPDQATDHINGDSLDNRRTNLRIATLSQNQHNRKPNKESASKYKGVSRTCGNSSWRAQIRIKGEKMHLGSFLIEEEAAQAYDEAALKYFGEFALTNKMINERMTDG